MLLAFLLVALTAIGTVGFLVKQAADSELVHIQQTENQARVNRIQSVINERYQQPAKWGAVETAVQNISQLFVGRIIVVDAAGTIVADSQGTLLGTKITTPPNGISRPVTDSNGQVIGILFINPQPLPTVASSTAQTAAQPQVVQPKLMPQLIWSSIAAAGAAILLTLLLSRRILSPVTALARAARSVARQDFSARVPVSTDDEMGELATAFNAMAEELEHTERMRRTFIADAAHELRSPVTNIYGTLEAIRDGVLPLNLQVIESLTQESSLLTQLADDLQDLALADVGRLEIRVEPCPLSELVVDVTTAFQAEAQSRSVALHTNADASPQVFVLADRLRLTQIIRNLVSNALKATPSGGNIGVTIHVTREWNKVTVSDTGPGIPKDELNRIFERFYRVDPSRARISGGRGLGLTIASRLAAAHQGKIEVESELGVGSSFSLCLPRSGSTLKNIPTETDRRTSARGIAEQSAQSI